MISAFGVEHGEFSKADSAYKSNKRKGDIGRNVALAGLGAGATNAGVAIGRSYKANKGLYDATMSHGLLPPTGSVKIPKGAWVHKPIARTAGAAVLGGLAVNRVARHKQNKAAKRQLG